MIVDQIWQPSVKDVATRIAPRRYFARANTSGALAALTVNIAGSGGTGLGQQFGEDEVLILTHLLAVASAGAAQVATDLLVNLSDVTAVPNFAGLINVSDQGAGGLTSLRGSLVGAELVLFFQDNLLCQAVFDAGVASNSVSLSIGGFIIPRGNWLR